MIKFTGITNEGKTFVVFGLSDGNLGKLRENRPILVDLAELGVPNTQVMIMWGETEQAMIDELRKAGFKW